MRELYNKQLKLLSDMIGQMGALCETAISAAVKGLLNDDPTETQNAVEADKEIDNMERRIESLCLRLILEQQPVATDLKLITASLKIISDMERIGDQASDIASLTKHIGGSRIVSATDLDLLARAAVTMVTDSIRAFIERNTALASLVIKSDDNIDALFDKMKSEIIDIIAADKTAGSDCIDTLMVAKYLERIGDHAENIAESVF